MTRPAKHSLTLQGHRTSVTLESEFWQAFRVVADERHISLNQLACEIDTTRAADTSLASAIRVFLLKHYQGH